MVHLVKAMVFLVVMYGCETWDYKESWAPKNWCFWTVVLEKTLRVPWTVNQPILKEISPEYSLEGLMLKLKLQSFGHLMRRTDSLEKTLMLGKTEGRRRGWQRIRWLDGIIDLMDMILSKLWELEMDRGAWHVGLGLAESRTWLSDWFELRGTHTSLMTRQTHGSSPESILEILGNGYGKYHAGLFPSITFHFPASLTGKTSQNGAHTLDLGKEK